MDFDFYVAARRRLLVEHAVELGATEPAASALVDAELSSSRRRIERADDPDPALFRAVEEAVRRADRVAGEPRPRRRAVIAGCAVLALATAAGVLAWVAARPSASDTVTVPSSFALGVTAASAALREVGLRVDVIDAPDCEPTGLVVGTSPPPGTPVDLGSTVTLAAAGAPGPRCAPSEARRAAWAFLRFARGGAAPAFDDTVFVIYNAREPAVLSRAAAADPGRWAAIQELSDLLRGPAQDAADVAVATRGPLSLRVAEIVPPATQCGIARPPSAGDRPVLRALIASDQRSCPFTIDLYRSANDEIDAVVIYDRE